MRLLIAEDELRMLSLLQDGLATQGHVLTLAKNGAEALRSASASEFDVLILDRMLPVMDGCEVTARLRKDGRMTPILMLTARDSVSDVVSALDAGVDDYLTKPFAFEVLHARLRALKRRPPAPAANVLRFHDLTLNVDLCSLSTGDKVVKLTRTEFRILEEMMRHPGRVHRRETLVERVWGYDCQVESNTLDVFICQLRTKIDRGRETRSIQTVRGIGYRLSALTA